MTDAEKMMLSDAIEESFRANAKVAVMRKIIIAMGFALLAIVAIEVVAALAV